MLVTDLPTREELPDSIAGFQAHLRGELHTSERTFKRKDGSPVRMSINSVHMEIDNRPCLVGFFSDVTEKRLLEEERLKTQKLEALGTLAGGLAHDFNNLLHGVFGYISLAKLIQDDKEKSTAALEEAEKALHMSVKLTNQLLTFSKGGTPVKKPIDLLPVIEDAAKFALSGSRADYRIFPDRGLWTADADDGQIGQVVQNIVLNADQAMPEGGRVEITARNVQSPGTGLPQDLRAGQYIEVTIRDSGVGIPKQYLSKIFDPYFTTKEKGSGLGLATSYSIMKNHGGLIEVKSEMGAGTTFSLYIPAVKAAQEVEHPGATGDTTTGKAGKILVMDDEELIRKIAGEMIRALGHEVELAVNGREAIDKYRDSLQSGSGFDVVILDLTVRGSMGGEEAIKELLEINPEIKAVVSSGYAEGAAISEYETHGFRACLKKPYNIAALKKTLNSLLH
jgi:signal transduction histidine kinase/ActR/RegA family two-component response regulator